jgi:hypothetical protein
VLERSVMEMRMQTSWKLVTYWISPRLQYAYTILY